MVEADPTRDYHPRYVGYVERYLERARRYGAEREREDRRRDERAGFEHHLKGGGVAHAKYLAYGLPAQDPSREVAAVDGEASAAHDVHAIDRHLRYARYERGQTGTLGAHGLGAKMSEDEHPVEQYVQGIGGQYDPHGDRGVAYAFEKLLERQEDHQRQNAPSQHVEVRHGQRYHVAYVVRAVLWRQHVAQRPHQGSLPAAPRRWLRCRPRCSRACCFPQSFGFRIARHPRHIRL